jgi:gliding motility associated protien GldN
MSRKSLFSLFIAILTLVISSVAFAQQDPAAIKAELKSLKAQIANTNKQIAKAKGAKKKNLQNELASLKQQETDLNAMLASGGGTKTKTKATSTEEEKEIIKRYPFDSTDYMVQSGYNPLSVIPVHISDIMQRTKMIRIIDFREKCNESFRYREAEFWKYVVEAYRAGLLDAFSDDSLNKVKNPKYVYDKLFKKEAKEEKGPNGEDLFDVAPIKYRELYLAEIKEDLLFDRQRSQTFYDIQSVGLILPAESSEKSAKEAICYFRYKDIERVLNTNPYAKWRNSYNSVEDRRFSDAFRLRLFCSRITKLNKDNPLGEEISALPKFEKFGTKGWLLASQQFEYDLVSQENELYDY